MHYAENLNPIVRAGEHTRAAMSLMKFPAETEGADGSWGECDDPFVNALVARCAGIDWGRAANLVMAPGECFIVGQWTAAGRMEWKVGSHQEVRWSNGDWEAPTWHEDGTPDGVPLWRKDTPRELRPTVIRCWHASLAFSGRPSSSLMGQQAQAVCEQLLAMQMAELAAEKSRLSNGILYVPTQVMGTLRMMSMNGQLVEDKAVRQKLQNQLLDPVDDPADPAGLVPLILYGPAEAASGLTHLTLEKLQNADGFARKRETLIAELSMLMPIPAGVLSKAQSASHWDAKLEDDNGIKYVWEPAARELADGPTRDWLRPYLANAVQMGWWKGDPRAYRIGVNSAALAKRPADAQALTGIWDRGGVGWGWVRRELNIPESAAPTPEEMQQWRDYNLRLQPRNADALGSDSTAPLPLPAEVSPGDFRRALPAGDTKGVTSAAEPRKLPAGSVHDGGMIAVMIPTAVAGRIAVPGGEAPIDLHCTLAALPDGMTLTEIMPVLQALDLPTAPLTGTIGGLGMFPPGPDGFIPVFAQVDVPFLAELRQQVVDALGTAGIPFLADHGWTPHVTLTYIALGDPAPAPLDQTAIVFGGLCATDGTARWEFPFVPVGKSLPAAAPIDVASTIKRDPAVTLAQLAAWSAPVRAARSRAVVASELADIGQQLNGIDNEARTALLALADNTLAIALRSVGREVLKSATREGKATERDPWRQAIAAVAPKGTDMIWVLDTPGGVVAAMGVDAQEKIAQAFKQFGVAAARIMRRAGQRAAQVWQGAGITASVTEERYDEAARQLQIDMEALALQRTNSTEEGGDARAVTPMQLIGAAVALAGGWQTSTSKVNVAAPGQPVTARKAAGIAFPVELEEAIEAAFAERLAVEKVRVATKWTWYHDHPQQPFQPHVELHGVSASAVEDFGGYWPGDHPYCLCHVEPSLTLIDAN